MYESAVEVQNLKTGWKACERNLRSLVKGVVGACPAQLLMLVLTAALVVFGSSRAWADKRLFNSAQLRSWPDALWGPGARSRLTTEDYSQAC
jgi:hypothetical protein